MQFKINGVLFVHPRYLYYRKYFFDLKLAIKSPKKTLKNPSLFTCFSKQGVGCHLSKRKFGIAS